MALASGNAAARAGAAGYGAVLEAERMKASCVAFYFCWSGARVSLEYGRARRRACFRVLCMAAAGAGAWLRAGHVALRLHAVVRASSLVRSEGITARLGRSASLAGLSSFRPFATKSAVFPAQVTCQHGFGNAPCVSTNGRADTRPRPASALALMRTRSSRCKRSPRARSMAGHRRMRRLRSSR